MMKPFLGFLYAEQSIDDVVVDGPAGGRIVSPERVGGLDGRGREDGARLGGEKVAVWDWHHVFFFVCADKII